MCCDRRGSFEAVGLFQYPLRRLSRRSREVWKQQDLVWEHITLRFDSRIGSDAVDAAVKFQMGSDSSKPISRGLEISRNLMARLVIVWWRVARLSIALLIILSFQQTRQRVVHLRSLKHEFHWTSVYVFALCIRFGWRNSTACWQYLPPGLREEHAEVVIYLTGPTHAKLVSLTSPCCSDWPCPMNTLKANNGPLDPGVGDERFFRFKRNAWNF